MWRSIAFCFALAFSVSVSAQPVTEAELAEHIGLLASDAYQGREPGTVGETQAAAYIAAQWSALGLKPSAAGGYWYQPVSLVDRVPGPAIEKFVDARGRMIDAEKDSIILRGIDQFGAVSNGQLIFIGFGEQADSQDMSGKIALMAIGASPTRKDAADYATRKARLIAAGASAVITMVDDGSWERRA
ncbi:MAG: hypothetical protein U5J78_08100 [Parasphingorhabdus sp.]|nr:hypothetical protein [Parasphingorhabdus sp.]